MLFFLLMSFLTHRNNDGMPDIKDVIVKFPGGREHDMEGPLGQRSARFTRLDTNSLYRYFIIVCRSKLHKGVWLFLTPKGNQYYVLDICALSDYRSRVAGTYWQERRRDEVYWLYCTLARMTLPMGRGSSFTLDFMNAQGRACACCIPPCMISEKSVQRFVPIHDIKHIEESIVKIYHSFVYNSLILFIKGQDISAFFTPFLYCSR